MLSYFDAMNVKNMPTNIKIDSMIRLSADFIDRRQMITPENAKIDVEKGWTIIGSLITFLDIWRIEKQDAYMSICNVTKARS